MKRLSVFALFIFMLTVCSACFAKIPAAPSKDIYVADFAGMIDDAARQELLNMGKLLEKNCGAQVVVVTVNSLDGEAIEEYANKLFRKWGIGNKKNNDGVLLLIAKEDRKFRIEVGYGLEGAITDGRAGEILDSMKESFRAEHYSEGVMGAYSRILKAVYDEKGAEAPENVQAASKKAEASDEMTATDIVVLTIFIIIIIIAIIGSKSKGGGGGGYTSGGFVGGYTSGGFSGSSSDESSFGGGSSGGGGSSDGW